MSRSVTNRTTHAAQFLHNRVMEQLLALDTMFLGLEDENVQSNIGGISVFEGPAPTHSELRRQITGGFEAMPIFRQRLLDLPSGLGRPLWIDDEDFDLDRHLIEAALGRDVTTEKVQDFFAGVMAQHLDRSHPLWKVHVVRGLPNDQWALLWTAHHAMVDGIAATELMALLLNFDPEGRSPEPQPWTPRPKPSRLTQLGRGIRGASATRLLRDLPGVLLRPQRLIGTTASTAIGMLPAGRAAVTEKNCPLNGPIGVERIWRTADLDLDTVKLAGTAYNCTVNDVVLAAVTQGLREYLIEEGVDLEDCRPRTMVPVSIRREDEQGVPSNRVSMVFVELPVEVDDPVERINQLHLQMDEIKRNDGEATVETLGEFANYLPHRVFESVERVVVGQADVQRFFNTVITNIPGPQIPLYCLGRRMLSLNPYVMLMKDVRISTAVLSYDGNVHFGVTGDRDSAVDVERVCRGIERALDELIEASAAARAA